MASRRKREESDDQKVCREWSNLPGTVLYEILQGLDGHAETYSLINTSRIHSVCSSWHFSVFPFKSSVHFPLKLPIALSRSLPYYRNRPFSASSLVKSIVFLVSPPSDVGNNQSGVWLIKALEPSPKSNVVLKLENMLSMEYPSLDPLLMVEASIDIFSCSFKEITRSYVLNYEANGGRRSAKVVLIWNSKTCDFSAMALFETKDVGLWRPGAKDWVRVLSHWTFSDIIAFEGKFYAISEKGKLIIIDPASFEWDDITPMDLKRCYGLHLNFVESNACLYVVKQVDFAEETTTVLSLFPARLEMSKKDNKAWWNPVDGMELEDRVFLTTWLVRRELCPLCRGRFPGFLCNA